MNIKRCLPTLLFAALLATSYPCLAQDGLDLVLEATTQTTYTAPSQVTAVAVTFGSRIAAGTKDGTLLFWPTHDSQPFTVKACRGQINAVKFSPDGTMLAAAGDDGQVSLWQTVSASAGSGKPALSLTRLDHFNPQKAGKAVVLTFSQDGAGLAAGYDDGSVRVWGMNASDPIRVIQNNKGRILVVSFQPRSNDLLSIVGEDAKMSTWSLSSGEETSGDVDIRNSEEKLTPKPSFLRAAASDDGQRYAIHCRRYNLVGDFSGITEQHWIHLIRSSDGRQSIIELPNLMIGGNNNPVIGLSQDGRLMAVPGASELEKSDMYLWDLSRTMPIGHVKLSASINQFAIGPTENGYQLTVAAGNQVVAYQVNLDTTGVPTVPLAVVDFAAQTPQMGASIADLVRTEISKRNEFIIVDPNAQKELINDLAMQDAELSSQAAGDKVVEGKLLLARKNVVGTIGRVGQGYSLSMRFIDKATAKVEWQDSKTAASDSSLRDVAQSMTLDMLGQVASDTDTSEVPAASIGSKQIANASLPR